MHSINVFVPTNEQKTWMGELIWTSFICIPRNSCGIWCMTPTNPKMEIGLIHANPNHSEVWLALQNFMHFTTAAASV